MRPPTLDPKLDVVFKLLFAAPKNRDILLALLNAVLAPEHPIVSVDVLNPEIDREMVDDRGLFMDILARHDDGTRTNVEMQAQNRGDTPRRTLYHWARLYRDGMQRGDAYDTLTPCRVVFFLSYTLFPRRRRLHSTFRVLEIHDDYPLNADLELHYVELTKLRRKPVDEDDAAAAWARFFAARTAEERRSQAVGKPDIEKATDALEELSEDPDAQFLARWREDSLRLHRIETAELRRKAEEKGMKRGLRRGMARGIERGIERGLQQGRQHTVRVLCEAFGIELTSERERAIDAADADTLTKLERHLTAHRAWPEDASLGSSD